MDHPLPLIIKVKCEGILRHFTAYVSEEGILNLNLDTLRRKVQFLFQISHDADFKLRYIDEDGDEITLFENSDLCEALTQRLNPLWINVALNYMHEKGFESSLKSCSSPDESAHVENLSSCIDYDIANAEVLGDIFWKISPELVERTKCLVLSELVECMSKMVISSPDVAFKHENGENVSLTSSATSTRVNCPKNSSEPLSMAFIRELFSSRFVFDLNYEDFTLVAPSITFSMKLKLHNNGARAWPHKSKLVWIGGDLFTDEISMEIENIPVDGLPVGEEVDFALNVKAPELPGDYTSYWKMCLPTGETFGQRIWISVQVCDPLKELDLNSPPPGCVKRR